MDEQRLEPFGVLLRRHRRTRGWTQAQLAERANVSVEAVGALERGTRRAPWPDTVTRLADALGLEGDERSCLSVAARIAPPGEQELSGPAPPVPIVGRDGQLAAIKQSLRRQDPAVVVVAGEPGIGKSRLLQETMRLAAVLGYTVVAGGCQRRSGQEPYAPLPEAFVRYVEHQPPSRREAALKGCNWLLRLVPELVEFLDTLPSHGDLPGAQERRLLFSAVARFLRNIAGPRGTLLVLDDLQWAGPELFDLLAVLLATTTSVSIAAGYRDTEVEADHALSIFLADLGRENRVEHIPLPLLSAQEGMALLKHLLPGERDDGGMIVERTGGLPFFLVSYAQGIRTGSITPGDRALPWNLTQTVRQRVASLPRSVQAMLSTLAVARGSAPLPVLARVLGRSADSVLEDLETARHAGLLQEETFTSYRFAHDVIAEVVEGDTSAVRRAVLHARIASALEDVSGEVHVEQLAYHYAAAGDTEKTLLYLEQAGDRARSRFAHASAESYYRDLLERVDALQRPDAAATIRQKLGEVFIQVGRYQDAINVLKRAAEEARTAGNLEREGTVSAALAEAYDRAGEPYKGLAVLRPVVAALEASGPSAGLLKALCNLRVLAMVTGDVHGERAARARAQEVATAIGASRTLSVLESTGRYNAWLFDEHDDRATVLEEILRAIERARAIGDLRSLRSALHMAIWMHFFAGELAECKAYTEQIIDVVRKMGDSVEVMDRLCHLANVLRLMGEWEQSRSCLQEAEFVRSSLTDPTAHRDFSLEWGTLALLEGDWGAAAQHLDEAIRAAERISRSGVLFWARFHRALLDLERAQPDEALTRLTALAQGTVGHAVGMVAVMWALAWAYIDLGELNLAETWASRSVEQAVERGKTLDLHVALRMQGRVYTAQGRFQEAEQSFEEALTILQRVDIPVALGSTHYDYARLKAETGDRKGALGHFREAYRIFARLGAKKDLERAEQALANVRDLHPDVG